MRPAPRLAHGALRGAGWLALLAMAVALALERSGWLTSRVRDALARELGPLGEALAVADVRLRWFEPAVELRGVTLGPDAGLLVLDAVDVGLAPLAALVGNPGELVESIRVRGGSARVSDELVEGLQSIGERREEHDGAAETRERGAFPTVSVEGFELRLELPGDAEPRHESLPLGRADLRLERTSAGMELSGRLVPSFPGSAAQSEICLHGLEEEPGLLDVSASARELFVDTRQLPERAAALVPLAEAHGVIALQAGARFHLDGLEPPEASARLELVRGFVRPDEEGPVVFDVELRADVAFRPAPGRGLWSAQSWAASASLSARCADVELEGWARAGRRASAPYALEGWLHAPDAPVDAETLEELRLDRFLSQTWAALEPHGRANLAVALRLPRGAVLPRAGEPFPLEVAVDARATGAGAMRFRGWPDREGRRNGVPLRVDGVRGRIVFARHERLVRRARLGLVDLAGQTQHGVVHCRGVVASPLVRGDPPVVDIGVDVPRIAIDEELVAALDGARWTEAIAATYAPEGGELSGSWRSYRGPDTGDVLAHRADFAVRGARMRWAELPVPLDGVDAELTLRWGLPDDALLAAAGTERRLRPFGVHFRGSGALETGGAVDIDVTYRAENGPLVRTPAGPGGEGDELALPGVGRQRVSIDSMALRGRDWDVLTSRVSELLWASERYGWKGRTDLEYTRHQPAPGVPFRVDVEAVPELVELLPEDFPVPTRGMHGRVLASVFEPERASPGAAAAEDGAAGFAAASDAGPASGRGDFELAIALNGTWSDGVAVAVAVERDRGAPGLARLYGAGIDPSNRALLASLGRAVSGRGRSRPDVTAIEVQGRLDAVCSLVPFADAAEGSAATYRLHLRNNRLAARNFVLDDMSGVVVQEAGVMRGDTIRAKLAGTPVELRNARYLHTDDVGELEQPHRLLAEQGFLPEKGGYLLQSELYANDVPLDADHLRHFLDEPTLVALTEGAELRGRIDLDGARIVLADDGRGGTRLGAHGDVLPHNASVRVGLPIQVSSGRIAIEELLLEAGGLRGWARVEDLYARAAGRELARTSMTVTLVESRLSLDELTGELEGGSIASLGGRSAGGAALAIDLVEPYFFSAALEVGTDVRVDADRLLRGLFATSVADKGHVRGWMRLSGTPGDLLGLRGSGEIHFSEARLWSIPVLRELFTQLGFDGSAVFDEMRSRFELSDGVVHMLDVQAKAPVLRLVGSGTVDLVAVNCDKNRKRFMAGVRTLEPPGRSVFLAEQPAHAQFKIAGYPLVLVVDRNSVVVARNPSATEYADAVKGRRER